MKNAHHEALWGLDLGLSEPYQGFTPEEKTIVDFRLSLPEQDHSHLVMQHGLEGIAQDIVSSPHAQARATRMDAERLEAVRLEIKRSIRI